jgi:hypothetical protein
MMLRVVMKSWLSCAAGFLHCVIHVGVNLIGWEDKQAGHFGLCGPHPLSNLVHVALEGGVDVPANTSGGEARPPFCVDCLDQCGDHRVVQAGIVEVGELVSV